MDEMKEEMKETVEETIEVEEETVASEDSGSETNWTEEIAVVGEELLNTVKQIAREASARHIVIKNGEGRVLIEFPLVLGVAGMFLLPAQVAVISVIGALVTDCTITVVRSSDEKDPIEVAPAD